MTANAIAEHPAVDRVTSWALAGLVIYVVTWPIALFGLAMIENLVLGPQGWHAEAGTQSLSIRNAALPIAWGTLAAAASAVAVRRWIPGARIRRGAWLVLGIGLVMAALSEYETDEFVRRWAGVYDPEYAGLSLFIPDAMVALTLASWAALAVARGRRAILGGIGVVAAAGLAAALATNLPGAAGGVREVNVPIATAYLVDAVFAFGALLLMVVDPGPEGPRSQA